MKSADMARKEIAFIQWDIPAKKQTELLPDIVEGRKARIDKAAVTITSLGISAGRQEQWVRKKEEWDLPIEVTNDSGDEKQPQAAWAMMDTSKVQQVLVDRKILISLLEGMTEPAVLIAVTDNRPMFIASQVGDRPAAAWIAPIIKEEEE